MLAPRVLDLLVAQHHERAADALARLVRLDTNRALTEAIAMYRRSGYVEVERFNEERYAHHWFEKALPQEVRPHAPVPVV